MPKVGYAKKVGRFVRRVARKARGKVIKRYFSKGYKPKISTISKDIAMLKTMVNAEKKFVITSGTYDIGQCNINANGYYLQDLTPNIGQGVTQNTKSGASVKWHSCHIDMQVQGQGNNTSGIKIKYYVIRVHGQAVSNVADVIGKFITSNPFITGGTIYDYGSSRNPDYFKDYSIVATKTVSLPTDTYSGVLQMKRVSLGFRLKNHHIRWSGDSATVTSGQLILLGVADRGNSHGSTASTLTGIPISTNGTGANVRYEVTNYFYDN